MIEFSLIHLENTPIFEQLQLEEALLRTDEGNFCIINSGSTPAIVMGISAKPEEMVDLKKAKNDNIPLIKRFSGGGTVYIDEQTLFVTFICQAEAQPTPHAIMEWSEKFYAPLFPHFRLRENDYVFGEHKFGGNAQYIRKGRWLHHTSFLWDYQPEKMNYLHLPKKRPQYRQNRSHTDFLCRLKDKFTSKETLLTTFKRHLKESYPTKELPHIALNEYLARPHRKSTQLLT